MSIVQRKWLDYDTQWLDGFRYRVPFYHLPFAVYELSDGGAEVSDIPVLITIGSSVGDGEKRDTRLGFVFDEIGSNFKKMAVTTEDGVSQQYVCVVQWDAAAGEGFVWFKAPTMGRFIGSQRVERKFYLYFDGLAADNDSYVGEPGDTPSDNVWSDYLWGFFLQEEPQDLVRNLVNFVDGTNDGRFHDGAGSSQADFDYVNLGGGIKKSVELTAADNQYIDFAAGGDYYPQDAITLFALQDLGTRSANMRLFYYGGAAGADRIWEMGINSSSHWFAGFYNNNVSVATVTDTGDVIGDGIAFLTASYNGGSALGDITLHLNGAPVVESTPTGAAVGNPASPPQQPYIGTRAGGSMWWDGKVAFAACAAIGVDKNYVAVMNRSLTNALWIFQDVEQKPQPLRYRIPVAIKPDNVDSDQTAVNVKIFLHDSAGVDDQDVSSIFDTLKTPHAGRKIRITAEDGISILPAEIIYWDEVDKFAVLSVKIYQISATDGAHFFIYYDDNATECGETVYHSDFASSPVAAQETRMLYRVSKQKPNFPGAIAIQATNSGWDGMDGVQSLVNLDEDDLGVDADLGPYLSIDYTGGDNEYIRFPDRSIYDRTSTDQFTVEMLVRLPNELTAQIRIFAKRDSAGTNVGYEVQVDATRDTFRLAMDTGPSICVADMITTDVDDGNWHHVVVTYDGSDTNTGIKLYLDGADDTRLPIATDNFPLAASMANAIPVDIGARNGTQVNPTALDVIEVSWTASEKDADYVKMQYHNLFDGLLRFDAVEYLEDFTLAPAVLSFTALPAFWIGVPTVFILPETGELKFLPGMHTAVVGGKRVFIGDAWGAKPKILASEGALPHLT